MEEDIIDAEYTEINDTQPPKTEGFGEKEAYAVAKTFERVFSAYNKGNDLKNVLVSELADSASADIDTTCRDIVEGIAKWNADRTDIDDACFDGQKKEEWFAQRVMKNAKTVDVSEYGEYLAGIATVLHKANNDTLDTLSNRRDELPLPVKLVLDEGLNPASWDEETLNRMARQLGQEISVAGIAGTALETGWALAETTPFGKTLTDIKRLKDALQSGDDDSVKEAASVALKISVARGEIPFLPKNTPMPMITSISCFGVEQAKLMLKYADGEISGREVLEQTGRAAMVQAAEVCGVMGTQIGQKIGMSVGLAVGTVVPVLAPVGGVIGRFIGGIVGKAAGSKIGQIVISGAKRIASTAKEAAKNAWETAKSVGRSMWSGAKNLFNSIFG